MNTSLLPRILFWIQVPAFYFLVFIGQDHSQKTLVTSVFLSPPATQGWLKTLLMSFKVPRFACVTTPGMVSWSVSWLLYHCTTCSCGYYLQVDVASIYPHPTTAFGSSSHFSTPLLRNWSLHVFMLCYFCLKEAFPYYICMLPAPSCDIVFPVLSWCSSNAAYFHLNPH